MSQGALALPVVGIVSGLTFSQDANAAFAALLTKNSGGSAPTNAPGGSPVLGQEWLDTTSATLVKAKLYTGTAWIQPGVIDVTSSIWVPPMGGGTADVTAAGTTDLGSVPQVAVRVTGGAGPITSLGSNAALSIGQHKIVTMNGVYVLTYSATDLILPGNANITTAVGDVFGFQYLGTGKWRCTSYQPRTTTSPIGKGRIYSSRAAAAADSIPAAGTVDWIEVHGYAAVGDSPRALYTRVSTPGAPRSYHFQSADGQYWIFTGSRINPLSIGALDDNSTTNTTFLQAAFDYQNINHCRVEITASGLHASSIYRSGALLVNYDYSYIDIDDSVTVYFPTLGAGVNGITVSQSGALVNYVTIRGGKLQGPTKTVSISSASPGVVTDTAHGLVADTFVSYSDSPSGLPNPIVATTAYYVKTVIDADHYTLSATLHGAAINTTGGAGTATRHTYVNECGISSLGTSTTARADGLYVYDVEICNFGNSGVYHQFVSNPETDRCHIHECSYAGQQSLSIDTARFTRNRVQRIAPGSSGNRYGATFTHESSVVDANAGTQQGTNPYCWDMFISENTVEDCYWAGIDSHGGYHIYVGGNNLYASPLSVSTGSNLYAYYCGWGCRLIGNYVDARHKDGTTSGFELTGGAIAVDGGVSPAPGGQPATVPGYAFVVADNVCVLYGQTDMGSVGTANSGVISAKNAREIVLANNNIKFWNGVGIMVQNCGGIIQGNRFGSLVSGTDGAKTCILDNAAASGAKLAILGNQHDPTIGGLAAVNGFYQSIKPTFRPMISNNDFSACSTPFSLFQAGWCLGNNLKPVIFAGTGATVALAEVQSQDCEVVFTSGSSYSVTAFSGFAYGQRITLRQTASSTVTITRDGAAIKTIGGTNISLSTAGDIVEGIFDGAGWSQTAAKVTSI